MRKLHCLLLVLLLGGGGFIVWQTQRPDARPAGPRAPDADQVAVKPLALPAGFTRRPDPILTALTNAAAEAERQATEPADEDDKFKWRLANTEAPIDDLIRNDHAVLLRNALIDTRRPLDLAIPESLRSSGDPGSYVVQSRGAVTRAFRARIEAAGGRIVSYIPNNAFLVVAAEPAAGALAALADVQAVVPFEPYYKLDPGLLKPLLEGESIPNDAVLNVAGFPGLEPDVEALFESLGAEIVAEQPGPFGRLWTVRSDQAVALAGAPAVQGVEQARRRVMLNDLTRVQLGVSQDTLGETNYLGLTGTNVLVNVNDTGVDVEHPDLTGRVLLDEPALAADKDGHGTHIAGIIAGSGEESSSVTNEVSGSIPEADFRGMAPAASLFVMGVDQVTGPLKSDAYLQRTAALTNVLISNNSWGYAGPGEYDFATAGYDAAVRDALHDVPGSQSLLFVFAAGNEGFGNSDGLGGQADSVVSPAAAKNVITVGALETPRNITNEVVIDGETNQVFLPGTDSAREVAGFSSRGNVGIGREGQFGRFKPDVVAPGVFLASARSKDWEPPEVFGNLIFQENTGELLRPGRTNLYQINVPVDGSLMIIRTIPNRFSADPLPPLQIFAKPGDPPYAAGDLRGLNEVEFPVANLPGRWSYALVNTNEQAAAFDLQTFVIATNSEGDFFEVLETINEQPAPHYRFETGTSLAAASVSGVLALMQEFFEQRAEVTNSPALMKALLINGSRNADDIYDLEVNKILNHQGWGMVNLTNSIPGTLTNGTSPDMAPLLYFDQSPTNALATGDTHTREIEISEEARNFPLRVTLVWTDPPGSPVASLKLVNDLDLKVTMIDSFDPDDILTNVYRGNNFAEAGSYVLPDGVAGASTNDVVNNVENVYINAPLGERVIIEVEGRRVSVNAVQEHPDNIAQDFALVVSSEETSLTNTFTLPDPPEFTSATNSLVVPILTNGVPLFRQYVGANPPLLGTTNGMADQWRFFVFTNNVQMETGTNATNVAFATFLPPNLASPRNFQADIDLYVSTDPAITNLDAAVLDSALKSRNRGGTESIVLTNSDQGVVYYAGVKSEDQQAAEFAFFAIASILPFSERDDDGNLLVRGMPPTPVDIPDGSPESPQSATLLGFVSEPITVRRVVVTNTVTHDSFGDLIGNISHAGETGQEKVVVLNNHGFPSGRAAGQTLNTFTFVYDDSEEGDTFRSQPTDGPGTLLNFTGDEGIGVWLLTMVDDSPVHTGTVNNLSIRLEPQPDLTDPLGVNFSILPNRFRFDVIDVPIDATNMIVELRSLDGPLEVYVKLDEFPTRTEYDKREFVFPPGGALELGLRDSPPLVPGGRYFIGLFNPSASPVTGNLRVRFEFGLDPVGLRDFTAFPDLLLPDEAEVESSLNVGSSQRVIDTTVGVRIDHPRASDLELRLVSPQGSSVLLAEARGGTNTAAYGGGTPTNTIYTTFTENTNLASIPIKFATPPFTNSPVTGVRTNRLLIDDGFELSEAGVYAPGQQVSGWLVNEGSVTVISDGINADTGTNFLRLNGPLGIPGGVLTNVVTSVNRDYELSFAFRRNPAATPGSAHALAIYTNSILARFVAAGAATQWSSTSIVLRANSPDTAIEIRSVTSAGPLLDSVQLMELANEEYFYYLPEETLDVFKNEVGLGDWTLRVRDTRAGATVNPTPTLVSWQMQILFAPAIIPTVTLTNGIPFTGTSSSNEIQFFRVEVPPFATMATNTLSSSGDMRLFGARAGLPQGDPALDDYFVDQVTGPGDEVQLIHTNATLNVPPSPQGPTSAPLRPGSTYYLGVQNVNPTEVNPFTLVVDFDVSDIPLLEVTPLTNSIPFTNTITQGVALDYYQYDVAPNGTNVMFEILNPSGDVDLVIRRGLPLPHASNPSGFDYASRNPGTADELIVLDRDSQPVPLTSGRWYIGVFNFDTVDVTYSVMVTEEIAGYGVIELTNGVPYLGTAPPGTTPPDYFRFTITDSTPSALFELYDMDGNVDLYLQRTVPPTIAQFEFNSTQGGTGPEQIVLRTNAALPDLNGDWYLAVPNLEATDVNFTIRAVVANATGILISGQPLDIRVRPATPPVTGFELTWSTVDGERYRIDVSDDLATWTTLGFVDATGTSATFSDPTPAQPLRFYRIVQVPVP